MANEKRVIDANALKRFVCETCNAINGDEPCEPSDCRSMVLIDEMPTVDAVEVVHARWLYDSGSGKYFCSSCDENAISFKKDTLYGGDLFEVCLTDYCPNCGALMDGGTEGGE